MLSKSKVTLIVSLLTALLIVSGCAGSRMASKQVSFSPTQTGVVKAMTFNIRVGTAWWDGPNRWNKRKQIVFDTIEDNAADVVGLQEALDFQLSQIKQTLPQYASYAVGRNDGKKRGESCAILYRKDRFEIADSGTFWFSKTPEKPGSKNWGSMFTRICSWVHLIDVDNLTGFYVYNVHLDHWSQNSRSKSVRLLAERIASRKSGDPFIILGDFNMDVDNPAMKYLQKIGYDTPYPRVVDAWQSVHPGKTKLGTYHKFSGRTSCPKIDHIPVSEHVQALDVTIDNRASNGRYPSDHYPVIATVHVPSRISIMTQRWSRYVPNP